jgi:putative toxin-antitoxin system antitoxin component (TIGR02293 family)
MKRQKTKTNIVEEINIMPFSTQKSIANAAAKNALRKIWEISIDGKRYSWSNRLERIELVRLGIPYTSIDAISKRMNSPIKAVLQLLNLPQTTYNKKKSEKATLDSRDSELIVLLTEVIDYGIDVFNNEEDKFQRWLKKSNTSLGGCTPESLFDTSTGIDEVRFALHRLEFGNFA